MSDASRRAGPFSERNTGHTVLEWLNNDQQGSNVLATAQRLLQLERATQKALPPALAGSCRVARVEGGLLTLAVPSAAHASKLRQLAPRIVQLLAHAGWNLNEISIKVQASLVTSITPPSRPKDINPLDASAIAAFENLRDNTPPGPLADALARLVARHK